MLSTATEGKYNHLRETLRQMGDICVGYSGGVDSTLLLSVSREVLGGKALAVIGRSATYPSREFREAVGLAQSIGVRYRVVETEETDLRKFSENPPDRCYFCKTELFSRMEEVAREEGIRWIADGSITDDLGDFRPGMKAKSENDVRSPLLETGFSKGEVRELSRHLGLSTWDKPSFACLSSRFPYGTTISREDLNRIDSAENLLFDLGFKTFRVRFHDRRTARIEIGKEDFPRILDDALRERIVHDLKELGFTYVTLDLQGFRSGSMNEVLTEEVKRQYLHKS